MFHLLGPRRLDWLPIDIIEKKPVTIESLRAPGKFLSRRPANYRAKGTCSLWRKNLQLMP